MRKAFSANAPVLIFESQNTQNGKNIQNGYMDMFAGAMTGIRNPKAHENMTIKSLACQKPRLQSVINQGFFCPYCVTEGIKSSVPISLYGN
jgi:hypothetical protein